MELWILALLICGSACFALIIFVALRRQSAQIMRLQGYARDNGWSCQRDPVVFGKANTFRLSDPSASWAIYVTVSASTFGQYTDWHTPDHALSSGAAVFSLPVQSTPLRVFESTLPFLATRFTRTAMLEDAKSLGSVAKKMRKIASGDGSIVFATAGQEDAFSQLQDNPHIMLQTKLNIEVQPVVMRDKTGLRIRLHAQLGTSAELAGFASLCTVFSAALKG